MYLGPILDGVTFNNYPPRVTYKSKLKEIKHETSANYTQIHRIGYRFEFIFVWDKALISETLWESLRVIVNKTSDLTLIPFPDKYYSSSFTVKVIGGIDALDVFHYIGTGYNGRLMLETQIPVLQVPAWAV